MKKITLALFAVAASAVSLLHAQTVSLKFNPANGSRYDVINTNSLRMKQTFMGQVMNMDFSTISNMRYEIADAGAEKALTLTYGPVKTDISFAGQEMHIDSESPDTANAANKALRSIRGKKVKAFVAADGSVKKMEGWELVTDALGSNKESQAMVAELFSEATIKSLLEQGFKMYPGEAVSAGSTWTSAIQLEKPYKLTMHNLYTLKKIEGGKSLISIDGKVGTGGVTKMEQQGMEVEINLDGTVSGTISMDNVTGITDTSTLVQQLKGTMKVQGMDVPMEATVETNIQMKER
ncbi:DUF6263 family protein [Niabella sp. CC-SYL272]|uniref:DUF6263 family protein n=1 Tax=Niabella agricola TaxID=2891571 RepID=UPI001F431151|nr:DUF6263 family protein [Niabella agricola]MCF3111703.1 DUF6263 family protein [Niabella agricola]